MARTLASLKKRVKSIETTKKITNTMKLVSMAKYQSFQNELSKYVVTYQALKDMGEPYIDSEKESCVVCVVPDLGLVSVFVKSVLKMLEDNNVTHVYWIGSQGYEMIKNYEGIHVMNAMIPSESLKDHHVKDVLDEVMNNYNVYMLRAEISNHATLSMHLDLVNRRLTLEDSMDYEPNYDLVNHAFQSRYAHYVAGLIRTNNKVVEHRLRQINMDKASESAQEMLDHLNHEYHKLRQERITQEISEIVSGRM